MIERLFIQTYVVTGCFLLVQKYRKVNNPLHNSNLVSNDTPQSTPILVVFSFLQIRQTHEHQNWWEKFTSIRIGGPRSLSFYEWKHVVLPSSRGRESFLFLDFSSSAFTNVLLENTQIDVSMKQFKWVLTDISGTTWYCLSQEMVDLISSILLITIWYLMFLYLCTCKFWRWVDLWADVQALSAEISFETGNCVPDLQLDK